MSPIDPMRLKPDEELTDEELVTILGANHARSEVPPCRVCGKPLTIQSCGGGRPTGWGCSGMEDDPEREGHSRMAEGRTLADEHYSRSTFEDCRHPDPIVRELLRRFEGGPLFYRIKRANERLARGEAEGSEAGYDYTLVALKLEDAIKDARLILEGQPADGEPMGIVAAEDIARLYRALRDLTPEDYEAGVEWVEGDLISAETQRALGEAWTDGAVSP